MGRSKTGLNAPVVVMEDADAEEDSESAACSTSSVPVLVAGALLVCVLVLLISKARLLEEAAPAVVFGPPQAECDVSKKSTQTNSQQKDMACCKCRKSSMSSMKCRRHRKKERSCHPGQHKAV